MGKRVMHFDGGDEHFYLCKGKPGGLTFDKSAITCPDCLRELYGEQKPVVDEQKREMAQALVSKAISYEAGLCFCDHCHTSAEHFNNIHHEEGCIVPKAEEYLKSLEGE